MKLYYIIWVDCITKAKSRPQNKNDWKIFTTVFMSMSMALNLWFLLFLLMVHCKISSSFFPIPIDIFSGTKIDAFISFFISYLFPFLLINYYLIIYKEKYKQILPTYKYYNGKLFMAYFLGSIGLIFIYFIVAYFIVKIL